MMAMPSGRRSSEPGPVAIASGTAPSSAASVVIRIGRKRSRAGLVDGPLRREAALALGLEREVDQHDAVLLDDADQQDDADEGDHDSSMPASRSASSAPRPADGSVEMMVSGCARLS